MTSCNLPITRVALLIPCQLMEQGVERLLKEQADIRLIWHMGSVAEARLRLVASNVEMLIVAISTHQADWQRRVQLIRALRQMRPGMKIVVILDVYIPYFLQLLAGLNVSGILSQHESLDELRTAFVHLAQREVYFSPRLGSTLSDEMIALKPAALSLMELKVLQYLLLGNSIKRTANLLLRSEKTIMATKGKAMHKLGIRHSADLVAMRDMLEYRYRELTQLPDEDNAANSFQQDSRRGNRGMEILPTWLLPVDVIHSRISMSGSYPARKE